MALPSHRPPPLDSAPFSTESYFQTQRPPAGLEDKDALVYGFVEKWKAVEGKRVVLVTASLSSSWSWVTKLIIRVEERPFR